MQDILNNEGAFRFGIFAFLFCLMAVLEAFYPRRTPRFTRKERWFANLGIVVVSALLARLILPWAPVGIAIYAQSNQIGLMPSLGILGGVLVLDLCIYLQHVAMHKIPILWRLHRLHHADLDYDVTTGVRFHPIEIILSLLYKMGLILLFGIDPIAVVIFEMILNGMAMFNHANFALPAQLDRILRLVIVTPDFHRVHHSTKVAETDSNYGFNISIWDRIFRTYTPQPSDGHENMEIGLSYFRERSDLKFLEMLKQPFRGRGE